MWAKVPHLENRAASGHLGDPSHSDPRTLAPSVTLDSYLEVEVCPQLSNGTPLPPLSLDFHMCALRVRVDPKLVCKPQR